MKVLHASITHEPLDDRIFHREALSLKHAGHDLTVAGFMDAPADFEKAGISCIALQAESIWAKLRALETLVMGIKADIFHFHEIYTLPLALRYRKKYGAKIVYDIHEDSAGIIRTFSRRNILRREFTALGLELYERIMVGKCDALITVTPSLTDKFSRLNSRTLEVRNYPVETGKSALSLALQEKIKDFRGEGMLMVYAGQIAAERELELAVETCRMLDHNHGLPMRFIAMGPGPSDYLEEFSRFCRQSDHALLLPVIAHEQVQAFFEMGDMGWNVLPYRSNFLKALPNKSYEYLQAGIPFVCSDLPMLHDAVHKHNVGIMVEELDASVIAERLAEKIRGGSTFFQRKLELQDIYRKFYRWESQIENLLDLYAILK